MKSLGRRRLAVGVALAALGLGGCSALSAYREGQICTPDGAQRRGVRDARYGRERQASYAARCGVAEAYLDDVYRKAYDSVPPGERDEPLIDRLLGRRPPPRQETAEAR